MAVESLGEALRLGWRLRVRCAWGKRDGMTSRRECAMNDELDMGTLIWTRGAAFPIARLEGRLKCPRCGSRRVALLFDVPTQPMAVATKSA